MSSSETDESRPLLAGGSLGPSTKPDPETAVVAVTDLDEPIPAPGAGPYGSHKQRAVSGGSRSSFEGSGLHNIALSWRNISVTVKIPGKRGFFTRNAQAPEEKLILKNVTGIAPPGTLLAIMGASGSGKSTLLNVLTARNTRDYTTQGEVQLNGVPLTGNSIRNVSAYVQQSDLFIHTLTVMETLMFRALLRMDKKLDIKARYLRVQEVIQEMGLSSVVNSRIGSATGTKKGISGGERKRLSFACEALTNPPIFFCDEPTSSLDTFMAQSIVQTLQRMAGRGRAILCTIHQPSSELYAMFSQVLLLSEGRVAFMGSSHGAMDFFNKLHLPCPRNFNPADHYILTLAIVPGKENESRQRTKEVCDAFAGSNYAQNISEQIDMFVRQSDVSDLMVLEQITGESKYDAPMGRQLMNLFWRSWTSQYRDKMLFWTRLMQTLTMAIVLGLIYLDLSVDQKGVTDINGALFIIVTNVSFTNMFAVLTSFPEEMNIVMREYGSGLYRVHAYFLTKTVAELPLFAMVTALFVAVTYWMMGLNDTFEAFSVCCGVSLLAGIVSVNLGYLISVVTGDTTLALSVTSPIIIPFMIFGGPFMNGETLTWRAAFRTVARKPLSTPDYFIWMEKISWFKYAYEVLMINQWDDYDHIPCPNVTIKANATPAEICSAQKCLLGVVMMFLTTTDDVTENLGILSAIMCGIYLLTFLSLGLRARRSRE